MTQRVLATPFERSLCAALDGWQREWQELEERKETLDELLKHGYGMCDALGITPSANPGMHQMTFYRRRRIIYGPRTVPSPAARRAKRALAKLEAQK